MLAVGRVPQPVLAATRVAKAADNKVIPVEKRIARGFVSGVGFIDSVFVGTACKGNWR